MFRSVLRRSNCSFVAEMRLVAHGCAPSQKRKVSVLGAVRGIGMPLSLLASNPLVSSLALYDSEIQICMDEETQAQSTPFTVRAYKGEEQLGEALEGSDIVMIPAYVPRKPGMTHDHLFNISAGIVKSHSEAVAKYCPNALVNVIGNPVHGMVPIAAEVFKSKGVYDERKLFGVTTNDVYTARRLYAAKTNVDCADVIVNVPVIGGHAGITTLPLFSQATPSANLSHEEIVALTKTTQDMAAVDEAIIGFRSARASIAYAGSMFAYACLQGLNGVPDVVECSFVQSTVTDLPFFASKVRLGKNGVEEVLGLGPMTEFEKQGLEALKPELKSSIEKGIAFVRGD